MHAGSKQTLAMARSRKNTVKKRSRTTIKKNLADELENLIRKMTSDERKQFHLIYMNHYNIDEENCNSYPTTPVLPSSKTSTTITTPVGRSGLACLQQVQQVTKSTLAKNADLPKFTTRCENTRNSKNQGKDMCCVLTTPMVRETRGSSLPTNSCSTKVTTQIKPR